MDKLLSYEQVVDQLKRLTYKPETKIVIEWPRVHPDLSHRWVQLTITDPRIDTTNPEREIFLTNTIIVPTPISEDHLHFDLRRFFHDFEKHEADEWLRIGGTMIHDPHAEVLPPWRKARDL